MNNYYPSASFRHTVYGIFNFAYLLALLFAIQRLMWTNTFRWFFHISLVALLTYMVYYNVMVLQMRDSYYFGASISRGNFLFHYLVYPFMVWITTILLRERPKLFDVAKFWPKAILWFLAFFVIFLLSAELDNILLLMFVSATGSIYPTLEMSHKVGYPLLWGGCAFLLVLWGIRYKNKDYRILSLSLFSLIILKLFLFDVWKMSEGGRIASFIFLGIVLLVVSFLYQKLKRFIMDENDLTPKA